MRKTLTCVWFVIISISFVLFSSSLLGQSTDCCAVLSRIWYDGKDARGRESDIIKVYRADRPVKPQLGMPLKRKDKIEGKDPLSEFEITWHPKSQTPSSQIISAFESNPAHVKIVDCDGIGVIESFSDTLVIIQHRFSQR